MNLLYVSTDYETHTPHTELLSFNNYIMSVPTTYRHLSRHRIRSEQGPDSLCSPASSGRRETRNKATHNSFFNNVKC